MIFVITKDKIEEMEGKWEELLDDRFGKGESPSIDVSLDGFIMVDRKDPKNWFTASVEEVMNMPKDELLRMMNDWEYHGYVQTKKGMQYAAEFGEKGELCLLIG